MHGIVYCCYGAENLRVKGGRLSKRLASLDGILGVVLAYVPDLGQIGLSYFIRGYLTYFLPYQISHVRFFKDLKRHMH